jgi:hypothetical protein
MRFRILTREYRPSVSIVGMQAEDLQVGSLTLSRGREKVCPMLLRIFCKFGEHHKVSRWALAPAPASAPPRQLRNSAPIFGLANALATSPLPALPPRPHC